MAKPKPKRKRQPAWPSPDARQHASPPDHAVQQRQAELQARVEGLVLDLTLRGIDLSTVPLERHVEQVVDRAIDSALVIARRIWNADVQRRQTRPAQPQPPAPETVVDNDDVVEAAAPSPSLRSAPPTESPL
jgi:hypothetical protein